MNRKFEERKHKKVYAKSKENQAIIKALNMYGRVPEQWELLEEIERLKQINEEHRKINGELREEIKHIANCRDKAIEEIKHLENEITMLKQQNLMIKDLKGRNK